MNDWRVLRGEESQDGPWPTQGMLVGALGEVKTEMRVERRMYIDIKTRMFVVVKR